MNFIEKFLTKHHLIHKPHKWFLALLSAPLYAGKKYYKNKYHLNYGHAKKLFFFDIFLIFSIFLLFGFTLFWFTYDPDVKEKIDLSITTKMHGQAGTTKRIKSGEHLTYIIKYKNKSDRELKNPSLTINLPEHFQVQSTKPEQILGQLRHTVELPNLKPGSKGEVEIAGFFYGPPNEYERITAHLNYRQQDRKQNEQKIASILHILQGSWIDLKIESKNKILPSDEVPITIIVKNTYHHPFENIEIPLQSKGVKFKNMKTQEGEIENNKLILNKLNQQESVTVKGGIKINTKPNTNKFNLSLVPYFKINNTSIPQDEHTYLFDVVQPEVDTFLSWKNKNPLLPGGEKKLTISIKNTGNTDLENVEIEVPAGDMIDTNRLKELNPGLTSNGAFKINKYTRPKLKRIKPKQKVDVDITVPIKSYIKSGNNLNLRVKPRIHSRIKKLKRRFSRTISSPPIKVATSLNLKARARYYTPGGDQLGRGPLPPRVGKTSKYWILINFNNTTNRLENLKLTASLPDHVSWTGESSVSKGKDVQFNPAVRKLSWSYTTLQPHSKEAIYIQLGLTPTKEQRGATPVLLKNIKLQAIDSYTNKKITKTIKSVDSSLPTDKRALQRGVKVR